MKKIFLKKILTLIFLMSTMLVVNAQGGIGGGGETVEVSGPIIANVGVVENYIGQASQGVTIYSADWIVMGGVVQSSTSTTASILWTINGTGEIVYIANSSAGLLDSRMTVTVSGSLPAPPNPIIISSDCGNSTLQRVGSPPVGVSWYWQTSSNGNNTTLGSGSTFDVSASGTYYLRANFDASLSWSDNSGSITATVKEKPSSPINNGNKSYCDGSSIPALSVTVQSGKVADWYSTSAGGTSFYTGTSYQPSTPGTFYVEARDTSTSCVSTSRTVISVTTASKDNADFNYNTAYCKNESDPTPTITGLLGGLFSSSSPNLVVNPISGLINLSSSLAGIYTITYLTNGPCPNTSTKSVRITSSDASFSYDKTNYCKSEPDPTPIVATSGGTFSSNGGLVINQNTGEIDLSTALEGIYTVTYTTGGQCSESYDVGVIINSGVINPIITITNPTTCGGTDGSITITSPTNVGNTYSFDGGGTYQSSPIKSGLPSGNYYIMVKNSSLCESNSVLAVIEVPIIQEPTLSSVTQPTCSTATGSFTITNYNASYIYAVSPSSGVSISGLTITAPQGTYTVTATQGSCSSNASASRTVNAPIGVPTPTLSSVNQPECGLTGSFTITNYNASFVYTVSPSSGVSISGSTITAPQGTYTVTATQGSCSSNISASITVNEPIGVPTPTLSSVNQPECGLTGSFTITNYNATYVYTVSPSSGVSISGSTITAPQGTYAVTATQGSCSSNASASITVNAPIGVPTPTLSSVNQPECGLTGSFTITNYNATYVYTVSPSTGVSISGSTITAPQGTYAVTATQGSCSSNASSSITVNAPIGVPTPTLSTVIQPTCTMETGSFTITNYNASYVYTVSPSAGVSMLGSTITAPQGSYTVIATQGSCSSNASSSITVNAPIGIPTPTLSTVTQPTCTMETGSFTITNYNASYVYTVSPSAGVSMLGSTITAPQGSYTVIATQGSCGSDASTLITVNIQPLKPTITLTDAPSCSTDNITYSLAVTSLEIVTEVNGIGTIANTSGNNWVITGVPVGTNISLKVTNSNGCMTTLEVTSPVCTAGGSSGGSNYNYIYTISPQMPLDSILNELDDDNLQRNITYFDGLGRPMQNIAIAQGGNKEDVITHIGYDEIGRQDKDYLPYTDYGNTKNYRNINPEGATLQYYNTNFGTELDPIYPNPFSKKDFEASPLNRVLKQAAPGKDWKLGNGNEIEFDYQTNSINEVRWFEVSLGTDYTPTLEQGTSQYYPANELYKTITRDENHTGSSKNHTTEEFKDKQGKVILKRTYADINSISTAHDTYYIYDDYGNLTFVLPPKMEASPNTTTLATIVSQLNELGYHYQYDYRNRLVEKTIPGKGVEYIVYDKLDRPVLTQDAVQRMASKWLFTKYDAFSRVAYTGVYINIASRAAMQQLVDEKTTIQTTTSSSAPTPVTLQNSAGVNLSGTTISRTASGYDWTKAYFTTNQSVLGNGSIEFVASDVQFIKIGLDASNNNTSYAGIDYSMEVVATSDSSPIKINENWITKTPIDKTYSVGDILKIERIGTTVYYKKNDVVIYTSLTPSTGELYGNGFIYTNMFGIQNLTITNNNPVEISILENTLFESRTTIVNDINGTPIYYDNSAFPSVVSETAPVVTTTYTDLVGVSVNGTTVTKTGSTSWSNARFATVEGVTEDGYLQFPITVNSKEIRIGLDVSNSGVAYNAIDYSIRVKSTGGLTIYENSSYKSSVSSYSVGDIIKIERVGTTVYYKLNDVIIYTSMVSSTGTLYGNCSLYTSTAKVQDVEIYNEGAAASLGLEVLTINYYDDYNFGATATATAYGITSTTRTKGLSTGSKVKVLGQTNNWITTTSYYDEKARPIYVNSTNEYLGTTDIVESKLDFVGKVLNAKATHNKTGQTQIITEDIFVYDHAGRLKSQTQTINGVNPETIVTNSYDELGQLIGKGIGNTETTPLQTVNYAYNIRGWLKNINNDVNNDNDLFDFKINYNTVDHLGTALFNGNIAETEWKTQNDNVLRWYKYEYDALNRLTNAVDNLGKLNETLNYDKNGNINNLVRLGHVVGGSTIPDINNPLHFGTMDNLTYSYVTNSNKLAIVSDAGNDIFGFKDDQIGTGTDITTDYTYDTNGNMLTDANKGIININYNHLNLPSQVTFAADKYIDYIYDATGVKLEKVVTEGINIKRTKYAGNFIYEKIGTAADVLKFFSTAEGYVEPNGGTGYNYVYQYKDHLGNIRLSYKDISLTSTPSLQIVEENNYYPFGLKHKGYNTAINGTHHKYMFGGKEFDESFQTLNTYDFGARNYDPALGRWMNIDPFSELMMSHSPYNYAFNNPVYFTDFMGLLPDGKVNITDYYRDKKGNVWYDPNVHGPDDVPDGGKYIGPTYYDNKTGTYWDEDGTPHESIQQLDEIVITGKSRETEVNFTLWGFGGDTSGRKGSSTHSIDISELVIPSPTNNGILKFMSYIVELFSHANNMKNIIKPNKSTMENKVEEESKNVSKEVKVVLYHYNIGYREGKEVRTGTTARYTGKDSLDFIKTRNYDSIKSVPVYEKK